MMGFNARPCYELRFMVRRVSAFLWSRHVPLWCRAVVVSMLLAGLRRGAAAQPACLGDCDGSGIVTVNDLVTMVNVALGTANPAVCTAGDANGDGIQITEIVGAVNNALGSCPALTPTTTPTPTPMEPTVTPGLTPTDTPPLTPPPTPTDTPPLTPTDTPVLTPTPTPTALGCGAARFWVGDDGNWSDTNHWSCTSGGSGGASVPDATTDCTFDASSFTRAGVTVNANVDPACHSLTWVNTAHGATFDASVRNVSIAGSLTLESGLVWMVASLTFTATDAETITTSGVDIGGVTFNGVGGTWTLQDDWNMPNESLQFQNGTLNTNDKTITIDLVTSSGEPGVDRFTLNLGGSLVVVNDWGPSIGGSSVIVLNAGSSTIQMSLTSGEVFALFDSDNFTYNRVYVPGISLAFTVGSDTINTLQLDPGSEVTFNPGTTTTVGALVGNGTPDHPIVLDAFEGGQATLKALHPIAVDGYAIQSNDCEGVTPCHAGTHSVDNGGNTNWVFGGAR
jgi:hypothetical protein